MHKQYSLPAKHKSILQIVIEQSDFYKLYLYYGYLIGMFPKRRQKRKPMSPALLLELKKLNAISAQIRLVCREGLRTAEQVEQFITKTQEQIQTMKGQRTAIYNQLRRCKAPEERLLLKSQRDRCTQTLTKLRKDQKNAQEILARTPERCNQMVCELELRERLEPKSRSRNWERER